MLRVVIFTLHHHCHHCYCHCQKLALDSSPLLLAEQSSTSIPSCNMYFATIAENRYGCNACGGVGGVSSFHARFCSIGAFCFAGFINLCGNWRKFTAHIFGSPWNARVNLHKPAVHAVLVLVTLCVGKNVCVVFLFQDQAELAEVSPFLNS